MNNNYSISIQVQLYSLPKFKLCLVRYLKLICYANTGGQSSQSAEMNSVSSPPSVDKNQLKGGYEGLVCSSPSVHVLVCHLVRSLLRLHYNAGILRLAHTDSAQIRYRFVEVTALVVNLGLGQVVAVMKGIHIYICRGCCSRRSGRVK